MAATRLEEKLARIREIAQQGCDGDGHRGTVPSESHGLGTVPLFYGWIRPRFPSLRR